MVSKMKTRHGNSGTKPEKENDVGGIASYELAREQRIKENLERMQKLGIVELSRNLKPTKTIRPYKRKLPPSPKSQRRSSRIPTIPSVDYSDKRGFIAPEVVKIELKGCHQCRQKSSSHRTSCCKCKAIQGQFCGGCLFTRYGENILEAMENPDWVCPVCRDICNCIQCRRLKGWKPLGNVYRKALGLGFKSVAHYLNEFQSPNGKLNDMDDKTSDEEDDGMDDKDDDDDSKHVLSEEDLKHEDDGKKCEGEDGDDDSDYKSDPFDDDDYNEEEEEEEEEESSSEEDD